MKCRLFMYVDIKQLDVNFYLQKILTVFLIQRGWLVNWEIQFKIRSLPWRPYEWPPNTPLTLSINSVVGVSGDVEGRLRETKGSLLPLENKLVHTYTHTVKSINFWVTSSSRRLTFRFGSLRNFWCSLSNRKSSHSWVLHSTDGWGRLVRFSI